jgi:hypothetical protein
MTRGGTALLPTPWVKPTQRGLRVEIPSRYNSFVRVLLAVWLAAWAMAEITIVLGWGGMIPSRMPATPTGLAFFLAFTAAGSFIAWHLAWVLKGREVIAFKDGILSISRGIGRRGGRPRTFAWDRVQDLRVGSFRRRLFYPSWGRRFVGKGDAYLAFRHDGEEVAFARGLTSGEARDLLELLRAHAV